MTELMKRYEAETGKKARDELYSGSIKLYMPTNDYIAWLESQLRWRPVSEKPDEGTWVTLRRIIEGKLYDELVWFYHLKDVADWETLIATLDATHWLPIPLAPEGE